MVSCFVLYTPVYRLMERKQKRFLVENCQCWTVAAKIGYVLGLLVYDKVVIEFNRKEFLVDCLLWKTFNMANKSITESTQAFHAHTRCTLNITYLLVNLNV